MYTLSRLIKTKGDFEVEHITKITDEQFRILLKDEKKLSEFLSLKSLFDITVMNLGDLQKYITALDLYLRNNRVLILDEPDFIALNINRLLLNYIFSFRTYIDHLETFLKRQFGGSSQEVKDFKKLTGNFYDNHFEYRFVYKLRNYAQHCGLPMDYFSINPSIFNNIYDVKIITQFDPKSLLVKFDGWGSRVRNELIECHANLEVMDVVLAFSQIVIKVQEWFFGLIEPSKELLETNAKKIANGKIDSLENLCITYWNEDNKLCVVNSIFRYVVQIDKHSIA